MSSWEEQMLAERAFDAGNKFEERTVNQIRKERNVLDSSEWWEVIPGYDHSLKTQNEAEAQEYYDKCCKNSWNGIVYLIHSKTVKSYKKE